MRTNTHPTVKLGELIVTAFDWAAQRSSDPREIPLLATKAVAYLLRRARTTFPPGKGCGMPASRQERTRADDHAA